MGCRYWESLLLKECRVDKHHIYKRKSALIYLINMRLEENFIVDPPETLVQREIDQKSLSEFFHMTKLRVTGRRGRGMQLRSELEEFDAKYVKKRKEQDRILITGRDIVLSSMDSIFDNDPCQYATGERIEFRKSLRRESASYLLENADEIMQFLQLKIASANRTEVTYLELMERTFGYIYKELIKYLSPTTRRLLTQDTDFKRSPDDLTLLRLCLSYGATPNMTVDMKNPEEIEGFYGFLVAAILGIDKKEQSEYQKARQKHLRKLEAFKQPELVLPKLPDLGDINAQFQLFLLRKHYQNRLERISIQPQALQGESQYSKKLLDHYCRNNMPIEESGQSPKHSGEFSGLLAGREHLSVSKITAPVLLEKLYGIMITLFKLESLRDQGISEGPEFAYFFSKTFEICLQQVKDIQDQKTGSNPASVLYLALEDLTRLIEYSFQTLEKRIKRDER